MQKNMLTDINGRFCHSMAADAFKDEMQPVSCSSSRKIVHAYFPRIQKLTTFQILLEVLPIPCHTISRM